jgi:hypothetical protein
VRLCDDPPFELVVGSHGDIDVRIGRSARHVTKSFRRVSRGGMRFEA